ncbi:16S rRNA (guanine(527)-N(7))-methyltransferase RsmG [Jiella marina]|uniref:16S rRNA (guanine(527)-N(7))-methyltransferase RsmG n=1 Tax=Jiella sp. LLJ827 TaxID=2917712 RepID=UPI002101CB7C|nr:16S rRNA (guanine(527)-N(7))-methyltransferase RsmG [Jiella sp. LLJ827]MCQ0986993.1 16S rRNA (guanine(527)-N(7))-methyltransferase RsmG [Jiella sp. LLJ827]
MRRDRPRGRFSRDEGRGREDGRAGRFDPRARAGQNFSKPTAKKPSASEIASAQAEGRQWFTERFAVSRETQARLDLFVRLLTEWQARINLVAPSTVGDVWHRHVADAISLEHRLPAFSQAVDLGSGGGLPALVIAACRPEAAVDMIESSGKKAAFLATAQREMGVRGRVHAARIEDAEGVLGSADIVTARALAPFGDLLSLVAPHISRETRCFFAKGRSHEQEISDAAAHWRFSMIIHESEVEDDSVVLEVSEIVARDG